MTRSADLKIADAINANCPFSGKPVDPESLTVYRDKVIGFCNPGCRDKFAANPDDFPDAVRTLFGSI